MRWNPGSTRRQRGLVLSALHQQEAGGPADGQEKEAKEKRKERTLGCEDVVKMLRHY